ncbi:MAG: hypothetical protein SFX18_19580 [Pirellulales bacterium]|nr:hypothetical protein [Pirellulales bacterium]
MQPSAPKSEHPKTAESSAANTNSPANHGEKKRYQPRLAAASLPRETKIGLTVLGLLTIIFGYVLYQRLSKPVELDAEQYLAKSATTSASGEKKSRQ